MHDDLIKKFIGDYVMDELVSVVITTHNRVSLLKQAVESVIDQTYKKLEIIIVDDGSDDGSETICDKYAIHKLYFLAFPIILKA